MNNKLLNIENMVVVITGGTGHIGTEISKGLIKQKVKLNVISRNEESQRELLEFAKKEDLDSHLKLFIQDISNYNEVNLLIKDIISKNTKIDGLINNAYDNSLASRKTINNLDFENLKHEVGKSVLNDLHITKLVKENMMSNGGGSIIFTSSVFGFLSPNYKMYLDLGNQPSILTGFDKSSVIQAVKVLASEWGRYNIRVNSISPGFFPKKRGRDRPDYIEQLTSRIPLQRIGKPEELLGSYIFLLSQASSYLTGHNLIIDGGYSVW